MPSLLRLRCSSRFLRSGLPRRLGMPSLRHASVATVPARPRCRHFTRSGRTWPSSQVRTLMTLLSIGTLCSRRWCSSVMVMNHNLSQSLSPSVESYISLGNSGRPARVTRRRGSPIPQWAAASIEGAPGGAASIQKPARDDACHNCGKLGHWAKKCRQPRHGQAHVA
jgi:hypothetical protein